MDTIKSYEYLSCIDKCGSISQAATELYVSQPALSQFIIRLEDELGAEILIRKATPLKFTEFGQVLLNKLRKIYLIQKSLKKDIEDINYLEKGRIVIGTLNYYSVSILAPLLPKFLKKYPGIEIKIVDGSLPELEEMAEHGKTDLSLLMLPLKSKELNYEYLIGEDVLIAINKDHPLAKKLYKNWQDPSTFPEVDLNDLSKENFIILTKGKRLRDAFDEASSLIKTPVSIIAESNDINNSLILASSGIGIALCTSVYAKKYKSGLELAFLSPKQKLSINPIVCAYNSSYELSKSSRLLLNMLKDFCQDISDF